MLPSFAPCRSSPGSLHAGEIASGMPLGCKRGAESGDLAPETDGVASPDRRRCSSWRATGQIGFPSRAAGGLSTTARVVLDRFVRL